MDAVTGKPVPGMDVCLLVTHTPVNFDHRRGSEVMRSEVTRTDSSGRFFFERWDDQIDWSDKWDGYGIAVTDPVAQWKDVCGHDTYLLGAGIVYGNNDIFQMETYFHSLSDSIEKNPPLPYFPVALVKDPNDPHPEAYRRAFSSFHFPDGALVRKIGDTNELKIALVPLLRDENECRLAQNPDFVDLCRQMNQSPTADALRTSWKLSPASQ